MQSEIRRLQETVEGLRQLCRDAAMFVRESRVKEFEVATPASAATRSVSRDDIADRLENA